MSGALVLQRGPLTQQPQQAVPVDWSNPITRGLYGLFSPGPGSSGAIVDAASGAIWTPDSPFPFSYGKNGRGALTNGASKRYYATLPQYPGTVNGGSNYAPGAVVLVARVNATSGTEVFVNNVGAWLGISGGQWSYNGGGNSANTTAALGRDQVVIFNVNLSNVGTIYVDGVASTATFAPNGFIAANPVSLLEYGTGGFSPANSALYQFAIFNRELTQAEVKSLTANPWQLFQAPRRRLWLAVNNSGTSVSATPGASNAVGLGASVSAATTIAASLGTVADAGLSASIAASTVVSSAVGASSAAGLSASVIAATTIAANVASASASGLTASVSNGTSVSSAVGSSAATGLPATIQTATTIACGVGAASAAGLSGNVSNGLAVNASTGASAATGLAAQIILSTTVVAAVGVATSSGLGASVSSGNAIGAAVGTAQARGLSASVVTGTTIAASIGAASATGRTAFIPVAQLIAASVGVASTTGLPAAVGVGFPAPVADARQTYRAAPRARKYSGVPKTRTYRGA